MAGKLLYPVCAAAVAVSVYQYSSYAPKDDPMIWLKLPVTRIDASIGDQESVDILRSRVFAKQPTILHDVFNNTMGVTYPGMPDNVVGHEWIREQILTHPTCRDWINYRPMYIREHISHPVATTILSGLTYLAYGMDFATTLEKHSRTLQEYSVHHEKILRGEGEQKGIFAKFLDDYTPLNPLFDTSFFLSDNADIWGGPKCKPWVDLIDFGNRLMAKYGEDLGVVNRNAVMNGFIAGSKLIKPHHHRNTENTGLDHNIWQFQLSGLKEWAVFDQGNETNTKLGLDVSIRAKANPKLQIYVNSPFDLPQVNEAKNMDPSSYIKGYHGFTAPGDMLVWDTASMHDVKNHESGYSLGGGTFWPGGF